MPIGQQPQPSEKSENKKFAIVKSIILADEQEYVDPERRWAHNDLYSGTTLEVIRAGDNNRVLVRDETGEFWIPKEKLEML